MSQFDFDYRDTNQNQLTSDEEDHLPPNNTPEQPVSEISPFNSRPHSPLPDYTFSQPDTIHITQPVIAPRRRVTIMAPTQQTPPPFSTTFTQQPTAGPSSTFSTTGASTVFGSGYSSTGGSSTQGLGPTVVLAQPVPTQMPVRGTKNAPKTFKGKYRTVDHFFKHLEQLFTQHRVTSSAEKCKYLLEYCSYKVQDFITASENYQANIWDDLKEEVLKYYDAEKSQSRYRPRDLSDFLRKSRNGMISSLSQWKKYYRYYSTIAGQLLHKGIINRRDYDSKIWDGFPKQLRRKLATEMKMQHPGHNMETPYAMDDICKVAESHFQRNKFLDMTFSDIEVGEDYYSDSEDDSSGSESDSEEDSEDEARRKRKKKELLKKRKVKKPEKTGTAERENVQRYQGTPAEVESMIHQLNNMSIQDRNYGHLYYKVMQLDTTGLAEKCVYREPPKVAEAQQFSITAPAPAPFTPLPGPPTTFPNNIPRRNNPPRPPFRSDNKCFGCLGMGHMMGDCPRLRELIGRNIIYRNPENRRYYMRNGMSILRYPNESIYDAAVRYDRSMPQSHLVTIQTGASHLEDYSYEPEDIDVAKSSSESDTDDGPYWKYAFQAKRHLRQPDQYEAEDEDDESYQAYPVERTSARRSTEARKEYNKVPAKPKPGKQVFDGVWPPDRRRPPPSNPPPVRSSPPANTMPNSVNTPARSYTPAPPMPPPMVEQRPVEARRARISEDVEMASPPPSRPPLKNITPHNQARSPPKEKSAQQSLDTVPEKTRSGPRQSAVSAQANTSKLVKGILDLEVSVPLRDLLGSSKEINQGLQNEIKLKNKVTPVANQITAERPLSEDALITVPLICNGQSLSGIIDTGSQLNIMREEIANWLQLPIDRTVQIRMNDANGGEGQLIGMIPDVTLMSGKFSTVGNFYVGDRVPFDLLLGRPWQHGNKGNIEEQEDGTFLVFRDPKTQEKLHQVSITTKHRTWPRRHTALTYSLTHSESAESDHSIATRGSQSLPQPPVTQSRPLLQTIQPREAQTHYFWNNGEDEHSLEDNGEDVHSFTTKNNSSDSSDNDSDKENDLPEIEKNGEISRKSQLCLEIIPKGKPNTNLEPLHTATAARPPTYLRQILRQAKLTQRKKVGNLRDYKSQGRLLANSSTISTMAQPPNQYHFPSHPHLNNNILMNNGLIRHPQSGTILRPAHITVSSTHGIITDLNRDVRIADQYYARVALPSALLTCHTRDGQLATLTGRGFLCLHYDGRDPEMVRAASLMTVDPTTAPELAGVEWQVHGNGPHHYRQVSWDATLLSHSSSHHAPTQEPPPPTHPRQPVTTHALNALNGSNAPHAVYLTPNSMPRTPTTTNRHATRRLTRRMTPGQSS